MAFIRSGRSIVNTPTGPSTANLIVSYPITQLLSHFHPFPLSHPPTFPLLLPYYSYPIHPAHPCSITRIKIETAERRDKHGKASQRSSFPGLRPHGPQAQGR